MNLSDVRPMDVPSLVLAPAIKAVRVGAEADVELVVLRKFTKPFSMVTGKIETIKDFTESIFFL